jgi:predicted dienelactone hydrolase
MLRRLAIPLALSVTLGLVVPVGVATAAPPPHAGPKADRVDAPERAGKVKAEKEGEDRARGPIDAPSEAGPYAVGRTTIQVADPDRAGRTLTVDVWYPSDAAQVVGAERSVFDFIVATALSPLAFAETQVSTAGGFPLVVFSHGSGGIRLQSWFLTEVLASHGFVVAAPDHAGNTALDLLTGTTTPFEVTARNRPLDVSLVIDELLARNAAPGDRFSGAIDPDRIGVIGHSFGGYTALAMASGWGDVAPIRG